MTPLKSPLARALVTLTAGLVLGSSGWWLYTASTTAATPSNAPAATAMPANSANPAQPEDALSAEQQALLSAPETQHYQDNLAFAKRLRSFLSEAKQLSDAQRDAQIEAFAAAIAEREGRGELALNEALLLDLALIEARGGDEASQKTAADALVARYRQRSAERVQAGLKDAVEAQAFALYKSQEGEIVSEVMSMNEAALPLGVSRDEYLRQRLQSAREAALAQASGTSQNAPQSN